MRRILAAAGLVAMLALGLAGTATAADAAPASDHACSGAACLSIAPTNADIVAERGQPVQLGYDIDVTGAPADLVITVHDSSGLAPIGSSVRLDGSPPATFAVAGSNLTVTLPALAAGSHNLNLDAALTKLDDQSSYASASVSDGIGGPTGTATSAVAKATLQRPDLKIIELFPVNHLTAGGLANASVTIFGDPSIPARLDLVLPTGFSLVSASSDENQKPLTCAPTAPPAGRVSCLGNFSAITSLNLSIRAAATDAIGLSGSLVATILPLGIGDATPADNTVRIPLTVVGKAAVVATLTPQVKAIYLNRATRYTITVTNQGPDTATNIQANILLQTNSKNVFTLSVPAPLVLRPSSSAGYPGESAWHIGTLAIGQSVSVTVTVLGNKIGATSFLSLGILDGDSVNTKLCLSPACESAVNRSLIVTAVPVVDTSNGGGTVGGLPATGGPVGVPLGLGLLALLSGAMLLLAARQRTS